MSIKKIIVTGDFTRLNEHGDQSQPVNIRWLYNLVIPAIEHVSDLPIECYTGEDHDLLLKFYSFNNLELSQDSWAFLYDKEPNLRELWELYEKFDESLVISFELPEFIIKAFEKLGISYIDFTIHPVRFLDDLLFGARSNVKKLAEYICQFTPKKEYFIEGASIARSRLAKMPKLDFLNNFDDVGIFASQTLDDKVLIKNGAFLKYTELLDSLEEVCARHQLVVVKPHPMQPNNLINIALTRLNRNTVMSTENFYRLLSAEAVNSVYSISSSTSVEAAYFGKKGHHLINYPYFFSEESCSNGSFISLMPVINKTNFWTQVFRSILGEDSLTQEHSGISLSPNRMRRSLNSYWGADILF